MVGNVESGIAKDIEHSKRRGSPRKQSNEDYQGSRQCVRSPGTAEFMSVRNKRKAMDLPD